MRAISCNSGWFSEGFFAKFVIFGAACISEHKCYGLPMKQ